MRPVPLAVVLTFLLSAASASAVVWEQDELRVLTYNIYNGGHDTETVAGRSHEWLEVIRSRNPDIILIQEANGWLPADSNYIEAYVESLNVSFPGEPPHEGLAGDANSPFDLAIITRLSVVSSEMITSAWLDGGWFYPTHGFFHAELSDSAGSVHVIDAHFQSGQERVHREKEARVLLQIIDGIPADEFVWVCGDFNSYSPVDVEPGSPTPPAYDKGAGPADAVGWEPVGYLLDRSYIDAFRTLHTQDLGYTRPTREFYGYPTEPNARVDFILRSPHMGWILETSKVVTDGFADVGSDHYAVLATYRRGILTAVDDIDADSRPLALSCSPNPFRSMTTVVYDVPEGGPVSLDVYSVEGRFVRRLVSEVQSSGTYELLWDGSDASDVRLPAGWYFMRLTSTGTTQTSPVLLLR